MSAGDPKDPPRYPEVMPREREGLIAVARGLSNAEIAGELVLGRIRAKLELRDRVQIMAYAYEHGRAVAAAG